MDLRNAVAAMLFINMSVPGTKMVSETESLYRPTKDVDVSILMLPGFAFNSSEDWVIVISGNGNARKNYNKSADLDAWVQELNSRMPEPFYIAVGEVENKPKKSSVLLNTNVPMAFDDHQMWSTLVTGIAEKAAGLAHDLNQAGFR